MRAEPFITWREHWPEYLIEAWALASFMVSAGLCTLLAEASGSPLRSAIADGDVRRALVGVAMGLTAVALIYSRWGQRSGAHMNPAVTMTYWLLGRTRPADAIGYVGAQFAGGLVGTLLVAALAGERFLAPPVGAVVTQPGRWGVLPALGAEFVISFVLMFVVLSVSSRRALAPYTGLVAGALVATFIAVEAPVSGMSMNPARSFASAAPAGQWHALWIYFVAPPAGMMLAGLARQWFGGRAALPCAKLQHSLDVRCIHCGHDPARVFAGHEFRDGAVR
jgi:aquaporin Z